MLSCLFMRMGEENYLQCEGAVGSFGTDGFEAPGHRKECFISHRYDTV